MLRLVVLFSLVFATQSLTEERNLQVGECLTGLVSDSLTSSYNYLQLASIFGSKRAYPGFASFYTKLSDEISSKSHDLTKMVAQKNFPVKRLITPAGISVRQSIVDTTEMSIAKGLQEARTDNANSWTKTRSCHQTASNKDDPFVQDYLEEHHFSLHVKVDKMLSDLEKRIAAATDAERPLIIYMIDEELLNTYGDRRKKVFS